MDFSYGMLHCRDYLIGLYCLVIMMVSSTHCLSLEFLHWLIDIATYVGYGHETT